MKKIGIIFIMFISLTSCINGKQDINKDKINIGSGAIQIPEIENQPNL